MNTAVKHTASEILALDRILARYGAEASAIRADLQHEIGVRIAMIWPQGASKPTNLAAIRSGVGSDAEGLADTIRGLTPRDDAQRALQSRA
jgi:hypothetical protein